ncbi:MAG: hypothetical protein ABIF82_07310 [Planctomycetota bacterium]
MSLFDAIGFVVLLALVLCRPAYAYLDPGTGSFVIQILIAGLVAGGFAFKIFWKRLVIFVSGLFSKASKSTKDE